MTVGQEYLPNCSCKWHFHRYFAFAPFQLASLADGACLEQNFNLIRTQTVAQHCRHCLRMERLSHCQKIKIITQKGDSTSKLQVTTAAAAVRISRKLPSSFLEYLLLCQDLWERPKCHVQKIKRTRRLMKRQQSVIKNCPKQRPKKDYKAHFHFTQPCHTSSHSTHHAAALHTLLFWYSCLLLNWNNLSLLPKLPVGFVSYSRVAMLVGRVVHPFDNEINEE